MDLSGGTKSSPRKVRAGSMRVVAGVMLSTIPTSGVLQDLQLLFGKLAVPPLGEATELHGANTHPFQGEKSQPYRGAGPSYYAVTALVNGQVEGGSLPRSVKTGELRGEHLTVFEPWAHFEGGEALFEVFCGERGEGHLVLLLYLGGRVGDMVGEWSVVGEEE